MIKKIRISGVRCIKNAILEPSEKLNIISGANGSGKTSILESINIISGMKHFKSGKIIDSINHNMGYLQITADALSMNKSSYIPIAISRKNSCKKPEIKIKGVATSMVSNLATIMPVQKITANTFQFLESSSKFRRGLLDWGMFHVKHSSFFPLWQQLQKAVNQRNIALKKIISSKQINEIFPWDFLIEKISLQIDLLRQAYFDELAPIFYDVMNNLCGYGYNLKISYFCGWDNKRKLMEELQNSITKDINQGYTSCGAHKADILFEIENIKGRKKASCVLSRGEMKLTVCAFKIAQSILFNSKTSRKCIFLLDDLPAELDKNNIDKVINSLITLDSQVFVTSIEAKDVTKTVSSSVAAKVFVVKKGNVQLT